MKTEKAICVSCRKKVDFIIRESNDTVTIGKMNSIPYIRKYAYCKECGNEVWVPEIDDYNAKAPLNAVFGKGTK